MSASPAAVGPAMRGTGAATRLIIASSVGNALEFYEILVYGYFAVTISKVFFPAANEAVSLLVTFGTFGISFLARPVGAIFLGAYGDRKGRKNALDRHRFDDGDAELCFGRPVGADPRHCRAASARVFRGRRVRKLDRLFGRTSARPRWVFCELAVVEPRLGRAGGDWFGRFADDHHVGRHLAGVGLADPVRRGSPDRSGWLLHPQSARGNARVC